MSTEFPDYLLICYKSQGLRDGGRLLRKVLEDSLGQVNSDQTPRILDDDHDRIA
jgi:hypothetical protein